MEYVGKDKCLLINIVGFWLRDSLKSVCKEKFMIWDYYPNNCHLSHLECCNLPQTQLFHCQALGEANKTPLGGNLLMDV